MIWLEKLTSRVGTLSAKRVSVASNGGHTQIWGLKRMLRFETTEILRNNTGFRSMGPNSVCQVFSFILKKKMIHG